MTITLVTGIGPDAWKEYAHRTLPEIRRLWSADEFILYTEIADTGLGNLFTVPKGWKHRWADVIPGFSDFTEWSMSSPMFRGRRPGPNHRWKPGEVRRGYAYRWDAAKFGKMAIYAADAARRAKHGVLVWLDADVMTHRLIPRELIESTLDGGADVAFLGRRGAHSETGFVAFRVPEGRAVAESWGEHYTSRRVLSLPEWHSAYVFDVAVRKKARAPRDLTPGGTGHVWFRGPFRNHADHLKGAVRKKTGASEEWEANEWRRMSAR